MTPPQIALWSLLSVALLVSVATDLLSRRILDAVTYPMMAVALLLRAFAEGWGGAERGVVGGLLGMVLGSLPLLLFAWRKKMGWGDVKLMAAVGAALGFPLVLAALVFVSLAGAAQAVVTLLWGGALGQMLRQWGARWAARLRLATPVAEQAPRQIPYGLAIALGTFWAMWWDRSGIQY